ncbi:Cytokinesis protein sepH [Leucoagaricus sp. SymC.cos]|nr:Cytokinesis protein sepH [Leucoagaricus sp. SymC.cos]
MASQFPAENPPNGADSSTSLQQLVLQIDSESPAQEVINKARDLNAEEQQLLVDVLSTTLSKSKIITQRHAYAWHSLIKIASSAHVFARNRTIKPEYTTLGDNASARFQVMRQSKDDESAVCSDRLVEWAHLSHPNILSLYAAFLEGEERPSFVSPYVANVKICDHAQGVTSDQRLPLISDVLDGLSYLHQLNIVHGGLSPETVLISDDGRALITDLDATSEESSVLLIRYSAPELPLEDDGQPTKAIDVLSGKVPFCQFANDSKANSAIARGHKPARPGQDGRSGNAINDALWDLLMMCWEYEAVDRPTSSKLQEMLSRLHIKDGRPESKPMIECEALQTSNSDVETAKAILTNVLSTHQPSSLQVPKYLCDILSQLVRDSEALNAATMAATKLTRSDTQTLVDVIELVVKDLPYLPKSNLTGELLQNIMESTHILPQYYRVDGVQYDSTSFISENPQAKLYEGQGLKVRVCVVDSMAKSNVTQHLASWASASHENFLPFHGVFHEGFQLCVILPYLKHGTLEDYAPTIPQNSRMVLISDVANGLAFLQNILEVQDYLTGVRSPGTVNLQDLADLSFQQRVVVSDEGRALIATCGTVGSTFFGTKKEPSLTTYNRRFLPPFMARGSTQDRRVVWSFGCLTYEVLSRKLPFYQFPDNQVYTKVREQGEPLKRPDRTDEEIDEIDDKAWELIMECCALNPDDRPDYSQIQAKLADMAIEEDCRPPASPLPIAEITVMRSRPEVDPDRAEMVLIITALQAEVLREPLLELIKNHTKDVAMAVMELEHNSIQTLVDFLDQTLKERLSISEELNRVLAVLSRITSSTLIFPQRYELKGVKHGPRKYLAEGGCGTVYQGADPTMCIKLMKRFDAGTLMSWVKEVILWAHSSHPNVLPFLGVFLEGQTDPPQTCLVSPFMKNGNLKYYAARLPQKSRLPLISDVVNGLHYLHDLGIVHGDLKGENVLISDEGRGLITDFGASHINTATAATGSLSLTTLRFSAPETVLGNKTPTKKFDIWSLGCLLYEALSRKPPYHQYKMDVQIISALTRKETPSRPGFSNYDDTEEDEYDWDDDIKQDYDTIDDQAWGLIVKCCFVEPEERPNITQVRESVVDLKIHDDRPASKTVPGAEISKLRL